MAHVEGTSNLGVPAKSVSEPELCNAHSSISEPAQVVGETNPMECLKTKGSMQMALCSSAGVTGGILAPEFSGQASQLGASGTKGDRAGGSEAAVGDCSRGGNEGGSEGGKNEVGVVGTMASHGANEDGDGGGSDAERESCTEDAKGDDCTYSSDASHGGGKEACRESLCFDGDCVGGGGGPALGTTSWHTASG